MLVAVKAHKGVFEEHTAWEPDTEIGSLGEDSKDSMW